MPRLARFVAIILIALPGLMTAQEAAQHGTSDRKVLTRLAPDYPQLARQMHIEGVVKVEAVVRPNGSVKSTRVVGGNPVLVDAAVKAVLKWKFEPNQNETTEVVQLTFTSPQ